MLGSCLLSAHWSSAGGNRGCGWLLGAALLERQVSFSPFTLPSVSPKSLCTPYKIITSRWQQIPHVKVPDHFPQSRLTIKSLGYSDVFYVCAWGLSSSTGSTFVVSWSVKITRLAPASSEFTRSWREGTRGETRRHHQCEEALFFFTLCQCFL